MQVVLNSNKASLVQNTLTSNGSDVVSLANATMLSYPNVSKKISNISPYISAGSPPHGNTDTFNIPQSNMWYLGRLKLNYTAILVDGTFVGLNSSDHQSYVALNLIRQIDTICNGQPIQTLSGEALKFLIMNSSASFQEHTYRYALPLNPVNEKPWGVSGTVACVGYVPLIASWFMSPENALNCSKLEQIQLAVTYKTSAEAGLSSDVSVFSSRLYTYKWLADEESMNKILVKNLENPLIEAMNTNTERQQCIGDLSTTQTMTSNNFNPVYKTHVAIVKTNVDGGVHGCPMIPIDSITVEIGGEFYCTDFQKSVLNYEQAVRGNGSHSVQCATTPATASATVIPNLTTLATSERQCYTIDWSLLGMRTSNSGLASMANLNKPLYTIKISSTLGASETIGSYWIFLVHEYWNVLEVDPVSKVIAVRASH